VPDINKDASSVLVKFTRFFRTLSRKFLSFPRVFSYFFSSVSFGRIPASTVVKRMHWTCVLYYVVYYLTDSRVRWVRRDFLFSGIAVYQSRFLDKRARCGQPEDNWNSYRSRPKNLITKCSLCPKQSWALFFSSIVGKLKNMLISMPIYSWAFIPWINFATCNLAGLRFLKQLQWGTRYSLVLDHPVANSYFR